MFQMTRVVDTAERIRGGNPPKKICAWCCKVMQEGAYPATHGICPQCAEMQMESHLRGERFAVVGLRGKS